MENKLLIQDIIEKVKSENYEYKGFGYSNFDYHLNSFNSERIWVLENFKNEEVMNFDFNKKEIEIKIKDQNAIGISKILVSDGWMKGVNSLCQ